MSALRYALRGVSAALARGGGRVGGVSRRRGPDASMVTATTRRQTGTSEEGAGAASGRVGGVRNTSSSAPSSSSGGNSAPPASSHGGGGGYDADLWQGMVPDLSGLCSQRLVPDDVLRFKTVMYMDASNYIPFPHKDGIDPRAFVTSPANFKVELTVSIKDLKLSEKEEMKLRCLVGSRYNTGKREIRLVSTRFMNRGHNAQYLVYLLENLVAEAKGLRQQPPLQHQQQQQEMVA